jgi:hypothetical protein
MLSLSILLAPHFLGPNTSRISFYLLTPSERALRSMLGMDQDCRVYRSLPRIGKIKQRQCRTLGTLAIESLAIVNAHWH